MRVKDPPKTPTISRDDTDWCVCVCVCDKQVISAWLSASVALVYFVIVNVVNELKTVKCYELLWIRELYIYINIYM